MSHASFFHANSVQRVCPYLYRLFRVAPALTAVLTFGLLSLCLATPQTTSGTKWVGTWSTAPQLVEPGNNPPSPGLSNNTLRQIVHVSIGGDSLRMRFSNEFSTSPVTIQEVHIAVSAGGGKIDTTTDKTIFFNGMPNVTMVPYAAIVSDPFQFVLQPLSNVTITTYFGSTSPTVTGHPGSRTTSYILTGKKVSNADFSGAVQTDHWYVINTIEVRAPDSCYAVAVLGNSITDGRGSGTNKQNRWPDELARRLQDNPATQHVAVLNEGIGGNCVLGACLGPSALSRFERDVLNQNGVKWLVLFEGINDIGSGATGVGNNLINAFTQMIDSAHAKDISVYGATLLPMKGSFYYSTIHETERRTLNEWIRNTDLLDGVIDLDKALRNPNDTLSLLPDYDSGDHLHPNEVGHHMMAEAVDLSLFASTLNPSTGVLISTEIPDGYALGQNYPNPFNPSTTITFHLAADSRVRLKVFNMLGQEVRTLVDQDLEADVETVTFDAFQLPSGMYLYRLQAGSYAETRKMVIMK
jgi:lysophospholipase L1-like esterase